MEKKGGIYGEREDRRGYGNSEPDIVLNSGSHEKYKFLRDEKLKTVCQNVQGLGSLDILSDKWWVMSDENWVKSDKWWFFLNQIAP